MFDFFLFYHVATLRIIFDFGVSVHHIILLFYQAVLHATKNDILSALSKYVLLSLKNINHSIFFITIL